MEWELWRSREVIQVKPHTNGPRGDEQVYTKQGRVIDRERLEREYEKLTPNQTEEHSEFLSEFRGLSVSEIVVRALEIARISREDQLRRRARQE